MQAEFKKRLFDRDLSLDLIRSDEIPSEIRFNVYRNNVHTSLIESLQHSFPTVVSLVGVDYFSNIAWHYIQQHLPTTALLVEYGVNFPEFVCGFVKNQKLDYLPDVARLDRSFIECANEADGEAIALETLAGWVSRPEMFERLCLCFTAPVRLIRSRYPIFSIWQAHQKSDMADRLSQIDLSKSETVLLTRPAFGVRSHQLEHAEAVFIEALLMGERIGQAVSRSGDIDLVSVLRLLIDEGAISALNGDC